MCRDDADGPAPGSHNAVAGPAKVKVKKTFIEYVSEDDSAACESATKTCPVFAQRNVEEDGENQEESQGQSSSAASACPAEKRVAEQRQNEPEMHRKLAEAPAKITARKTFVELDDGEVSPGNFEFATRTCPVFNRAGFGEPSFEPEGSVDEGPPPRLEDSEGAAYADQAGLPEDSPSSRSQSTLPPQKVKVRNTFIEWESEDGAGSPMAFRLDPTKTCPVFTRRGEFDEQEEEDDDGEAAALEQEEAATLEPSQPAKVEVMSTIAEDDEAGGAATSGSQAKRTRRPSVQLIGGAETFFNPEEKPTSRRPSVQFIEEAEVFIDPEDRCRGKTTDLPTGPAKVKIRNTFIDLDEDEATKSTVVSYNPMATCPVFSMRRSAAAEEEEEARQEDSPQSGPRAARPKAEEAPSEAACAQAAPGAALAPSMSRGSALHDVGRCEPCAWYWKPGGCRVGPKCRRCHMCPAGELKARRKVKSSMLRVWRHVPPAPGVPAVPGMVGGGMPGFEDPIDVHVDDPGIGIITQEVVGLRGVIMEADLLPEPASAGHGGGDLAGGMGFDEIGTGKRLPMMPMMPGLGPTGMAPVEPVLNSGSVLHVLGRCEPCAWFWRPGGCKSGQECRRCHLCPPGEVKARKKAKNRALHDILARMAADGIAADDP